MKKTTKKPKKIKKFKNAVENNGIKMKIKMK